MAEVLVIGGTGTLGRLVVDELRGRRHGVGVLSRSASPPVPAGVTAWQGDVRTGHGLARALEGTDTVVQSVAGRLRLRATEVAGMANLLAAAGHRHLVYVSIVGVDRHRFPYYRAKWQVEQMLEGSQARWTIQRATQFHQLLDAALGTGWFVRTPHLHFQPVDPAELALRLADLVEAGPSGRAPDVGGPDVLSVEELAEARRKATGQRTRLLRVPAVGFLGDFDRGVHLCPDHRVGRVTWAAWLGSQVRPGVARQD